MKLQHLISARNQSQPSDFAKCLQVNVDNQAQKANEVCYSFPIGHPLTLREQDDVGNRAANVKHRSELLPLGAVPKQPPGM